MNLAVFYVQHFEVIKCQTHEYHGVFSILLLLPASDTPTFFDSALTHNVYTLVNLHISLCCTNYD
jgi:hypothetical protein